MMRFNRYLSPEIKELLTKQYEEYIKVTPMTKQELRAVREWVRDGHSVYENMSGTFYDGQILVEFLTEWREDEYIRKQTKGMSSEEARKFALSYYGWDDEEALPEEQRNYCSDLVSVAGDELPFR